ncbi:MAG: hypothetical protein Q7Q73_07590 [Verrucomicrobiota bacterium JB024]|nr:hypothetical protein [Verrucomicrobiota bacterium JB024]
MYRAKNHRGFALIITLTLLAFVVLLMVSFASLTRVEMQAATYSQHHAQARQNAIMALSIAIGQVQKLTGPDQRATATADLNGSGQDGTHTWTGVWGNTSASDDYVSSPQLLGWLVSGNEGGDVEVDFSAASFGTIQAAPAPAYSPSDAVALGSAAAQGALATDIQLRNQPAQLLVGPGSVVDEQDYVVAPLVEVEASENGTTSVLGRYAWWVGDEGVKARFNLTDPWASTAEDRQERFNRLLLSQRSGIELMTRDGSTVFGSSLYDADGNDSASRQFCDALSQTHSYSQVPLLAGFSSDDIRTALRRRYHDITMSSRGVLADQLRGGLRRDLTVLFDQDPSSWTGSLKTSLDNVSYSYAGARRIADFQNPRLYGASYSMDPSRSPDSRSPAAATWEQVRSFYDYATTNSTGIVNVTPQTDTQMGVFPLVLRWGVSFDVSASSGGTGELHIFPHVVLWNPYNVTLRGSYRMRIEFANTDDSTAKYLYLVTPRLEADGVTPIYAAPYNVYHQEIFAPETPGTGKYSQRTMEFLIEAVDIPPGEAYVFTPPSTQAYNTSGDNILANTYNTTASFTRTIAHAFTPEEAAASALVLANVSGGKGGTMSFHLLDAAGNQLQLIDAVGLANTVTVNNNQGSATQVTAATPNGAFGLFRDISVGPVSSRNEVGFSFLNALQRIDARYNWLANYNQRAPSIGRAWFEWSSGFISTANWSTCPGRADPSVSEWNIDLFSSDPARAYTGPSMLAEHGVLQAILFNLPTTNTPVLSLGQLQHAALTFSTSGHEPTYPFGNAYAAPEIRQNRLLNPNGYGSSSFPGSEPHLTDVSYLLNRSLWDRFFFSGTPNVSDAELQARIDAEEPLPDGRLHYTEGATAADVRSFDGAAAHLMVDGAFNVNSTSVEAWTALFASLRGVDVSPANGSISTAVNDTPYVRTPFVPGGDNTNSQADQWSGYRSLTDAQVRSLAESMVEEVKTRGPFLSMADFVNRRLVAYPDETGLNGTLQAAMDRVNNLNSRVLEMDRPDIGDGVQVPDLSTEIWSVNGADYYLQNIKAPRKNFAYTGRSKGALAPGFISQADLLQALGPALMARSDTFVIRAYGESVNPMLSSDDAGYITGRAWCEAVVQRLPDYVDTSGNAAEDAPVLDGAVNLTAVNQRLGRRYQVVSFRWLTPEEL